MHACRLSCFNEVCGCMSIECPIKFFPPIACILFRSSTFNWCYSSYSGALVPIYMYETVYKISILPLCIHALNSERHYLVGKIACMWRTVASDGHALQFATVFSLPWQ